MRLRRPRRLHVVWDRDGEQYVVDGDRTELVVGWAQSRPAPHALPWGWYVEEGRPNVVWQCDRTGLHRLDTRPASLLARYAPYRPVRLR